MTEKTKEDAEQSSENGNVPNKDTEKAPRAQGIRGKRYTEKHDRRQMEPEVVPGNILYKTR